MLKTPSILERTGDNHGCFFLLLPGRESVAGGGWSKERCTGRGGGNSYLLLTSHLCGWTPNNILCLKVKWSLRLCESQLAGKSVIIQSKSISTKRNLLNHLLHQTASPGAVADMLMNFPAVAISLASLRTASAFRSAASFRLRSLSAHSLSGGNNSYTHTSTRFNHNRYYFASSSSLQQASTGNNMYWNRDNCKPNAFKNEPITQEARILALCDPTDAFNQPLYDGPLPEGAKLLKVGTTLSDFDEESIIVQKPNVIFVSHL